MASEKAPSVQIFDREKGRERQKKLKEEASRGYFDDFKELKDSKGKLFSASDTLLLAGSAALLPDVQVLRPDRSQVSLRAETEGKAATLLCVAFRSGAEEMLASWSRPFGNLAAGEDMQHIELSLVESVVMSWWPFKSMILRGRSPEAESAALKPKYLFHFGDAAPFIQSLGLSNRLTGYVFLVDHKGRVRWRGSGTASGEEAGPFLQCSEQLLEESKSDRASSTTPLADKAASTTPLADKAE